MTKNVLVVPAGIRYIGDWKEFELPQHPHIMDKQIPGCGFTEWCLTNDQDTILCSPRNMLILNKWEQHLGEVFRVHNDKYDVDLGVDKNPGEPDMETINKMAQLTEEEKENLKRQTEREKEENEKVFSAQLRIDLGNYILGRRFHKRPIKILVTYDSFRILKDVLGPEFSSYQVVIDEFQSIFVDSRFKPNIEMEFINVLQGIDKVCYLSATPMLDNYLAMIPEFKDLPYYELDWESADPKRIRKPNLKVRIINSIYTPAKKICDDYKKGKFETFSTIDKETGEVKTTVSREAMIFVNSVKNITQIIKKCGLTPEETNILCSNTPDNLKKIQKELGKNWTIGKVPLKDEPRKMFTLCTRTVYLGADFYSDNARSFILSDANVDCLSVDISLDLPQILGRQRLESNPWKNSAEFYYKTIRNDRAETAEERKEKMDKEKYQALLEEKIDTTNRMLELWKKNADNSQEQKVLMKIFADRIDDRNYKDDYVGINRHAGKTPVIAINHLVMISEQRAFDIQQIDYKDRFSVFSTIEDTFSLSDNKTIAEVKMALEKVESQRFLSDKLKCLCELDISEKAMEIVENQMDEKIREYLALGRDRIKACCYTTTYLDRELENIYTESKGDLESLVYSEFIVGNEISRATVKQKLTNIYLRAGIKASAKSTDLNKWFVLEEIFLKEGGKKTRGLKLISKKS